MWHLSWKLQPAYLSQAGNSHPWSMAQWNRGSARRSWSSWQVAWPNIHTHTFFIFSGRPDVHLKLVPLAMPWTQYQGAVKALLLYSSVKWSFSRASSSHAKETRGGISPGPFLREQGGPFLPYSTSRSLSRGVQSLHMLTLKQNLSAILTSNPGRVSALSRFHFLTSEMDFKSSWGRLLWFLRLLLTPHNEIVPPWSVFL